MHIGLKIKTLAEERKIKLPELAVYLGKTKQAVYDMVEKPDLNTAIVKACARFFGVSVMEFFDEGPVVYQPQAFGPGSAASTGGSVEITNCATPAADERARMLEAQLADKERIIADKETIIAMLRERLARGG